MPTPDSSAPAPRFGAGLAYDVKHGYLLLFGGADPDPSTPLAPGFVKPAGYNNAVSNETWSWDGSHWTLLHPPTSPLARFVGAMAYDPRSQHVILFGGGAPNSDPGRNDMWSWDGVTWTELHPTTVPSRWIKPAIVDGDRSAIVLIAVDDAGRAGGLWEWTGSDWTYVQTSGGPHLPFDFGLAYDPDHHEDVLAAGWTSMGPEGSASDTWTLQQTTWSKLPTASSAPGGYAHAVYDEARHQLLLIALGFTTAGPCGPTDWADATWTWDGTTWTRQHPSHRPPGALGSQSMAYDPIGRHVVMFGGKSDELGSRVINQTWAWAGTDWVQLA